MRQSLAQLGTHRYGFETTYEGLLKTTPNSVATGLGCTLFIQQQGLTGLAEASGRSIQLSAGLIDLFSNAFRFIESQDRLKHTRISAGYSLKIHPSISLITAKNTEPPNWSPTSSI